MADYKTTAEILEKLWQRFASQMENESGHKVSKRYVSQYYLREDEDSLKDSHALARWTNPGERSNYRIPTWRIPVVADKLRASQEELDALMMARLAEFGAANPRHEALVTGLWVADICERTSKLSADEQAVLDGFRAARGEYPHRLFDTPESRQQLSAFFGSVAATAWKEHQEENLADAVSDEEETAMRQRRKELSARLVAEMALQRQKNQQEKREKSKGRPLASVLKKLLLDLKKKATVDMRL